MVMKESHGTELSVKDDTIAANKTLSTQPSKQFDLSTKTTCSGLYKLKGWDKTKLEYSSTDYDHAFTNFGFRKITRTYLQEIHFDRVKDWAHRSFRNSYHKIIENKSSIENLPRIWMVNVLICSNRDKWNTKKEFNGAFDTNDSTTNRSSLETNRATYIRSPYAEFFDKLSYFVKVDGINMQDPSASCHLSVGSEGNFPPCLSSMLDLNWIRIASQRFFKGWHMTSFTARDCI